MSIRPALLRAPVSLAFCLISLLTFICSLAIPDSLLHIALFPKYVTDKGYFWTFLTYAAMPASITNFVLVSTLLLWFGSNLEPVLGRIRYLVLIGAATVASGIAYFFLQPDPAPPLIGGMFVVSAVGIAFAAWFVADRTRLNSGRQLFLVLVVCWIIYVLWASPFYLSGLHITAWFIGFSVAIGPIRRSQRPYVCAPTDKHTAA